MAIKTYYRCLSGNGEREMTMQEFKKWLKKYDADKDGRISKDELRDAIRATGGWFTRWKSRKGVRSADVNGDGFIDVHEIENLVEFAKTHLRVKIVEF
ncbi:hypothetical protein AAG906_039385 [Vitis piasezkii]|uniref:EF-hand domain-containing protein n=4 Tax=Vitis TaxID=3603 RepID=A5AWP9_VITVI|nr:calcium-binding protein CML37 [Vitis vinifera]QHQ96751.1 calmodulin-like protein 55 [Vitis amurensis]RVW40583.1 hypothetical protein CK203_081443 [Vitis vinifera]RVW99991.1 hypothetical protein CK203_024688 [Vitis vinifera]WKA09975.1 hypothetical protein VitviT2T_027582 [Vitis vinifera]CAN78406.1 hypothetical protein VITISV_023175 [Vitis vinifera]|eukprot:XP_002282674.1 PREDICTED: calcium-binding protein CML37 [Vitis vinifera]